MKEEAKVSDRPHEFQQQEDFAGLGWRVRLGAPAWSRVLKLCVLRERTGRSLPTIPLGSWQGQRFPPPGP